MREVNVINEEKKVSGMDLERVFSSFGYCVTLSEVGEGIKIRDLLASKTTDTHVGFRVTDKRATFKWCPISRFSKSSCLTTLDQMENYRSNRLKRIFISGKGQMCPYEPNTVHASHLSPCYLEKKYTFFFFLRFMW